MYYGKQRKEEQIHFWIVKEYEYAALMQVFFLLCRCRAAGSFFMVGGWVKMSATEADWRQKLNKTPTG